MRQKRAKTYRKLMSLYSLTFGFREPYQVLGAHGQARLCFVHELTSSCVVDAGFCNDIKSSNTDAVKQISTVLQGSVKPSTRSRLPPA
jgi:U3 small nucleolar RNA-associated protein 23